MSLPSTTNDAKETGPDRTEISTRVAQHEAALAPYLELLDKWAKLRKRRETTETDYIKVFTAFADLHQRKQLAQISRKDVLAFRDDLLSKSQGKATVSRKVGILKTLFKVAVEYELLTANPADQVRVIAEEQAKPRVGFTAQDLNQIFRSAIYTDGFRPKGAGREAVFWLPLLALYTGARIEELAQLLVDDIHEVDGLGHYLNITDEAEHAKLKNGASRRRIPIHDDLLDCGFMEYVETVRDRRYLFPDLKPNPRGKLGGYFSNFFSGYLRREVGITDRRKVFHSFRHTFKDLCRSAGIDEAVHDALTGHTNVSVGRKYGNGQYPLPPIFDAMREFEVLGLDIQHLFIRQRTRRLKETEAHMISAFYGVVIALCCTQTKRNLQPYVIARTGDSVVIVGVLDNVVISGALPAQKLLLVRAWVEIHREELIANWENGQRSGQFFRVDPLR